MSDLFVVLLYGVMMGGIYTLVGLGLTVVFGVTHILNFSHSEFVTMGAFGVVLLTPGWGFFPAVLMTLAGLAIFGALLFLGAFRRTIGNHLQGLALSLGLLLFLQNFLLRQLSGNPRRGPRVTGYIEIFDNRIPVGRLIVLGVTFVVVAVLAVALKKSWVGIALRATGDDGFASSTIGLSARRVGMYAFVVAAVLGAIAGITYASVFPVTPFIGVDLLLKGFVVVIIGGLGSAPGALVAAIMLGVLESLGIRYFDPTLGDAYGFVLMIIVLLMAPQGLFNRKAVRAG